MNNVINYLTCINVALAYCAVDLIFMVHYHRRKILANLERRLFFPSNMFPYKYCHIAVFGRISNSRVTARPCKLIKNSNVLMNVSDVLSLYYAQKMLS